MGKQQVGQQMKDSCLVCQRFQLRKNIVKRTSKGRRKCQLALYVCVILSWVTKPISCHADICSIQTALSHGLKIIILAQFVEKSFQQVGTEKQYKKQETY